MIHKKLKVLTVSQQSSGLKLCLTELNIIKMGKIKMKTKIIFNLIGIVMGSLMLNMVQANDSTGYVATSGRTVPEK